MHLPRRVLVIAGAVTVLIGAGTSAFALLTGPVGSNGVIHGCYATAGANGSHLLKLQNVGTSCPAGETAIEWNKKGPGGPAGASGPQGPQGPAGPPGPGLAFTVAQGSGSVAGIGSFETAILTCSPSYPLMISGGYEIDNSQTSATDYSVVYDMPVNANSWEVRIAVPSTAPANVSWHVQGVCAVES